VGSVIAALTFDVDCQTYTGATYVPMPDELEVALEALRPVLDRHPDWRATWFLRLDPDVDLFVSQAGLLEDLIRRGDELGWHYHGPVRRVTEFARRARQHRLNVSRMGFGRGSNRILRTLSDAGFVIDSTAMPRPRYPWSKRGVDWTGAPDRPYRPSIADYRSPGWPGLDLLEMPISCTTVHAPDDNQEVVRYLNPAYHPRMFRPGLERWTAEHDHLVTITHPYELVEGPSHGLLAFDPRAFEENVMSIESLAASKGGCEFLTLTEMAAREPLEATSA
jgi:hypothetical protein